jgi:DNA-binding LacI/PurR family transcriptional regulator
MVGADDLDGGRQMTTHLLSRGARRVATITGPLDTPGGSDRLTGYRQAMLAAGQELRPELVAHGDYSRASGATAMRRLLRDTPDLDAVFAASDLMAAGALTVLRERGRRVPDDVLVGGFDDAGIADSLDPPLTTMRQPFDRISSEMVRLLLARIGGSGHATVTVSTTLVRRASA